MPRITGRGVEADSVRRMLVSLEHPHNWPANANTIIGPPIGNAYMEATRDLAFLTANRTYVVEVNDVSERIRAYILSLEDFQPDMNPERLSRSFADACVLLHGSTRFQWKAFAPRYWNLLFEFAGYIERMNLLLLK